MPAGVDTSAGFCYNNFISKGVAHMTKFLTTEAATARRIEFVTFGEWDRVFGAYYEAVRDVYGYRPSQESTTREEIISFYAANYVWNEEGQYWGFADWIKEEQDSFEAFLAEALAEEAAEKAEVDALAELDALVGGIFHGVDYYDDYYSLL
jgi:O-acetyl-ADP-ribose deacetylase (regulator of RNase III)